MSPRDLTAAGDGVVDAADWCNWENVMCWEEDSRSGC